MNTSSPVTFQIEVDVALSAGIRAVIDEKLRDQESVDFRVRQINTTDGLLQRSEGSVLPYIADLMTWVGQFNDIAEFIAVVKLIVMTFRKQNPTTAINPTYVRYSKNGNMEEFVVETSDSETARKAIESIESMNQQP